MNKKSILILGVIALVLISFCLAAAQKSQAAPGQQTTPIPADKIMPITPPAGEKDECWLYYTNWTAVSYFSGWYPDDKVAIYFDPMDCGNPQNYPFQLTDVEFTLYDFAGVGTIDVRFSVEIAYADSCLGPGPEIYLSPVYTITTFYPNIVHIDFPLDSAICLYEPFFFNLQYMSGEVGLIPSVLMDDQVVDTCFQWVWYDGYSPPWWEWYNFWAPPIPGWVVLGISGYTGDQTDCPWPNHKMHFPQLPKPGGWDVEFAASRLADDWRCSETGPVTDIHFWISWMQDNVQPIEGFAVRIWSNNPVGPGGYSVPDTLLWERDFFPDDFTIIEWPQDLQGWLMPPEGGYFLDDHYRRFQINIVDIQDPFTQHEDTIYWLEIDFGPLPYIGWKETGQHWNDDAVIWFYNNWEEVIDPIDSTSIDLAFVITGEERNHYKTWRIDPEPFYRTVFVQDQFMDDSIQLDTMKFFSNPVRKWFENDFFDIIEPDYHLTWYDARGEHKPFRVEYVNQFESDTVEIDPVEYLLVPTQKLPHLPPESLDHYKAYRINPKAFYVAPLYLEDQFDSLFGAPELIDSLKRIYFLTPALKNMEHPQLFDSITHYVAYEIFPKRVFAAFPSALDQFGARTLYVQESEMLLVPTLKLWAEPIPTESLYWKPDYDDYAPSGMPDFDQKQDDWWKGTPTNWTFCGPVAVANCFWWFDSKYNRHNPGVPCDGWDQFPLVRDYLDALPIPPPFTCPPGSPGLWDDHTPQNVDDPRTPWLQAACPPPPLTPQPFIPGNQFPPLPMPPWGELVERLAWYFDTDGVRTGYCAFEGTYVSDMQAGIDAWFKAETLVVNDDTSTLADSLYERTWHKPTFAWVETLVEKCQDVILLLGFWVEVSPGYWEWIGGHYVTVAGINSEEGKIAISDPYYDNAEAGGRGRVRNGFIPHPPPPHGPTVHNDAGNVSHDIYDIVDPSPSPGGLWGLAGYPPAKSDLSDWMSNFYNQNAPDEFRSVGAPWDGKQQIHTEVEYAVEISPWEYPPDCGDANGDGVVNIADAVYLLSWLFMGGPPPVNMVKADVNHNGVVNIADVIYLVTWLFIGGPPPQCYDP